MAVDSGGGSRPRVSKVVTPKVTKPRFDEEKEPRSAIPPGLMSPVMAQQLTRAGVRVVTADTMQTAGGNVGPAANFNANRNLIYYNPRTAREPAAYRGVIQHELVHAATSNIPGLSNDWRAKYLYGVGQAAQGRASLGQKINLIAPLPLSVGGRGGRGTTAWPKNYFRLSEGIATRGNAYPGIPQWGDEIRRNILGG